jgi:hypothetical protein
VPQLGFALSPVADPVLASRWGITAPRQRLIDPEGLAASVRCPQCSMGTSRRVCPHCHMDQPHATNEHRNRIFAVIGEKETGKSHYIAVLIDQMRNRTGPALGYSLVPDDDFTAKAYHDLYYDPLFNKKTTIETTQPANVRASPRPLVYSLQRLKPGTKKIDRITLVFFDTAGEDLNAEDTMATVNKYIYRSDGIILLLDPLQLSGVRAQVARSVELPTPGMGAPDMLARVVRLIETGKDLSTTATFSIPIAVSFSKFDAVKPLIADSGANLLRTPDHSRGFDLGDRRASGDELESLVVEWMQDSHGLGQGAGFVSQLKTRFQKQGFFAVSALGHSPVHQRIAAISPWRVEDPLLWLLHENGLIEGFDAAKAAARAGAGGISSSGPNP